MQAPEVNRPVRLLKDIPELGLRSGEVGVVCSTWFAPTPAYEVEFQPRGHATRALVMREQIQPAEDEGRMEDRERFPLPPPFNL